MPPRFDALVEDAAIVLAAVENRYSTLLGLCAAFLAFTRVESASEERKDVGCIQSLSGLAHRPFDDLQDYLRQFPRKQDQEILILAFFFALGEAVAQIDSATEDYLASR